MAAAPAALPEFALAAVKDAGGIWISRNDDRSYRFVTLPNGMKALLIHDKSTDMAAASVNVAVGSFQDDPRLWGIAHALEHFLFMGSKKYPGENEYSEYLASNSGSSNAYTASENTCYQLEVAPEALKGALERFAGFFTGPLFAEESVERELQAVDSEHSKNIQSDNWRMWQLSRSTAKPGHPFNSFGTGDLRTLKEEPARLGLNLRAEVMKFHAAHYSAGRMALSILGRESLDTLQEWATALFAEVPNNGSTAPVVDGHPYAGMPAVLQHAVPIKDVRHVTLTWGLPEERSEAVFRAKPSSYLSHLLGHEGPGSVLSYLKARGWALSLYGGASDSTSGYVLFDVHVELTEAGLERVEDVCASVFAYIGLLRAAGPAKWIWEEEAQQAVNSFRFANKTRPWTAVTRASEDLMLYPPSEVMTGPSLHTEWRPDLIAERLALLVPETARIRVVGQGAAVAGRCDKEERWYGVKYGEAGLPAGQLARYRAAMEAYAAHAAARPGGVGADAAAAGGAGAASADDAASGPSIAQLDADAAGWAAAIAPRLHLHAANEFIASDFKLRHPELAAKQATAESTVGVGFSSAEAEGEDGEEEEGEEEEAAVGAAQPADGSAAAAGPAAAGAADADAAVVRAPPESRRRREMVPLLLRDDARACVWFHCDDHFGAPKAFLHADVTLPGAYVSPRAAVLTDLYIRLLGESLNEFAYAAEIAELRYAVRLTSSGMYFSVGGFSHKLPVLAARVAARIADLAFTDEQFAIYKAKAGQDLANWAKEAPLNHVITAANASLLATHWPVAAKVVALEGTTAAELRAFRSVLLASAHVEAVLAGNATEEEGRAAAEALVAPLAAIALPLLPAQHVAAAQRVARLPAPVVLTREDGSLATVTFEHRLWQRGPNPDEPNSAIEYLFQVGPTAVGPLARQSALYRLAAHLLREPFFDSLRTKQQLGYIVQAGARVDASVRGFRLLIQSNKVGAEELRRRIDAFLAVTFPAWLAELTPAKFAEHVRAVITACNETDKTLAEEAHGLRAEISDGRLDFTRSRYTTDALLAVTHADFCAWYHSYVSPGGVRRRALLSLLDPTLPLPGAVAPEAALDAHGSARAATAAVLAAGGAGDVDASAAAAAEGDHAATRAAVGTPSPTAGEAATAAGGAGLAREDVVPAAAAAAPAAAAAVEESHVPPAEAEVVVTPAQAAHIAQLLATLEVPVDTAGLPLPARMTADVASVFADAGLDLHALLKQAAELAASDDRARASAAAIAGSAGAAAAPPVHVRVVIRAKPEEVKGMLGYYAPLGAARLAAWREGRVKVHSK